jgi:hypothetical protein
LLPFDWIADSATGFASCILGSQPLIHVPGFCGPSRVFPDSESPVRVFALLLPLALRLPFHPLYFSCLNGFHNPVPLKHIT